MSKKQDRLREERDRLEDWELRSLIAVSDAAMELRFQQMQTAMEHDLALRDLEEERIRQAHVPVQQPEPDPEPTLPPRGPDGRFVAQDAVQDQSAEDVAQVIKAMSLDDWATQRSRWIRGSNEGIYQ